MKKNLNVQHSTGLKLAVFWFLVFNVGASIIGSFLIVGELQDAKLIGAFLLGFTPVLICVILVVCGAWKLKRWARVPLYVLILVNLVFGAVPDFTLMFTGTLEEKALEVFVFGSIICNIYALYEFAKALKISGRWKWFI